MSKVVTGLMNRDSGLDMVELRAQIRSLESSTWYKGTAKGTESAKLAGPQEQVFQPQERSGARDAKNHPIILWIVTAFAGGAMAGDTSQNTAASKKMLKLRKRKN